MNKIILLIALPLILVFCGFTPGPLSEAALPNSNQTKTSSPSTYPSNPGGWTSLFNGKTLNGWRGYQQASIAAWDVENGTLHCNGNKKDAAHTDLVTDGEYANFELLIEWKVSPASNSGILFHVNEQYPNTYTSGPEYQIIDDKGWPGELEPTQHTGCNYAMQIPDTVVTKPVGEWNTTKIIVKGAHVEHWLNGVRILQYEMWSPEWNKQKAAGKWKDDAAYGKFKTGHIALQYHGGDVWFRHIKLKTL